MYNYSFWILKLFLTIFFQLLERNVKCYERRKRCYDRFGWCYAGDEWGFCNDINYLPDEPDSEDPLFEVPTFIYPREVRLQTFKRFSILRLSYLARYLKKGDVIYFYWFQKCGNGVMSSNTRVCTGHISKAPSEYTFLVEKGTIDMVDRTVNVKPKEQ